MANIAILGAHGFIGQHLTQRLMALGHLVLPLGRTELNLAAPTAVRSLTSYFQQFGIEEVYQLAADMGGAGYIFTGEHDAAVMAHSTQINLVALEAIVMAKVRRVFFASSACVYPTALQLSPHAAPLHEDDAYPAAPDSEYGWMKLFSERLYQAYATAHGFHLRIARFHSIVGPGNTWTGGREKAFAAICRKVAEGETGGTIELWGDGHQTRTFLHVDDCVDGIVKLMASDEVRPCNLGSSHLVSIADVARRIIATSGKLQTVQWVDGPQGVRGRSADCTRLFTATGWHQRIGLRTTVEETYRWVAEQVQQQKSQKAQKEAADARAQ